MATENRSISWKSVVGWLSIAFFILMYSVELLPHHGPPITIKWLRETFGQAGLILFNVLVVLGFLALFPFRWPTKHVWKTKGVFIAFIIALMTEMFGIPLLLFLLAPIVDVPRIAPGYFSALGHWPAIIGTLLSLLGVVLIAAGWRKIHRFEGLVTDGVYRWMRHPQYTGIFLFTFGWLVHWPTLLTLILWPILVVFYVWLAKYEEAQVAKEFGEAYAEYARRTKRFIPFVV